MKKNRRTGMYENSRTEEGQKENRHIGEQKHMRKEEQEYRRTGE